MSNSLNKLLRGGHIDAYVNMALGIDDIHGNYSARDHALGPKILASRPSKSVYDLGVNLSAAVSDKDVQRKIREANIPYLKISIGTEMALLLQPQEHWVANTRSIWSHLLLKHGSMSIAREELLLYRKGIDESEMAYRLWCEIHSGMAHSVVTLAGIGSEIAISQGVEPGNLDCLWSDAVSNALYETYVQG